MNLHAIVAPCTRAVTPAIAADLYECTGSVVTATGRREPTYANPVTVTADVQPLSTGDIAHVDGLNLQGIEKAAYLFGDVRGINRKDGTGAALLAVGDTTYKVTVVFEYWETAGWCKVGLTLQLEGPPA